MLPKPKRIVNREVLDQVKRLRCAGCAKYPPSDPAHIRSVGAGGDDVWDNLLPLCRECHNLQHSAGWKFLIMKREQIKYELILRGREDLV
jgi:5-methylcytosine-specific restriction endonuclease McrA